MGPVNCRSGCVHAQWTARDREPHADPSRGLTLRRFRASNQTYNTDELVNPRKPRASMSTRRTAPIPLRGRDGWVGRFHQNTQQCAGPPDRAPFRRLNCRTQNCRSASPRAACSHTDRQIWRCRRRADASWVRRRQNAPVRRSPMGFSEVVVLCGSGHVTVVGYAWFTWLALAAPRGGPGG